MSKKDRFFKASSPEWTNELQARAEQYDREHSVFRAPDKSEMPAITEIFDELKQELKEEREQNRAIEQLFAAASLLPESCREALITKIEATLTHNALSK